MEERLPVNAKAETPFTLVTITDLRRTLSVTIFLHKVHVDLRKPTRAQSAMESGKRLRHCKRRRSACTYEALGRHFVKPKSKGVMHNAGT